MKPQVALLILMFVACGCIGKPQDVTTMSPDARKAGKLKEVRNSTWDEQERIVIGQVIGTQSELVSHTLQQAGIDCTVQGDEFHEISVAKHDEREAVEILAKESRQTGYEVIWVTE
jgi:hypothetical protein